MKSRAFACAERWSSSGKLFGWLLAIAILLASAIYFVNYFNLLHVALGDYRSVEVSRYMLGKWPTSWTEVERAADSYYGGADVRPAPSAGFVRFDIKSGAPDECTVEFVFRNLLGYPYTERRTLRWSGAKEAQIARDDVHSDAARQIVNAFLKAVRDSYGGKIPAQFDGQRVKGEFIGDARVRLSGVAILPGFAGRSVQGLARDVPCLRVEFSDRTARLVSPDGRVQRTQSS